MRRVSELEDIQHREAISRKAPQFRKMITMPKKKKKKELKMVWGLVLPLWGHSRLGDLWNGPKWLQMHLKCQHPCEF